MVRKSFGVAICRRHKGTFHVMMIQKRYTYEFFAFVYARYRKADRAGIIKLLNNMTFKEKLLIANMNFSDMWSNIWMTSPENYNNRLLEADPDIRFKNKSVGEGYYRKKVKFEANFMKNGGADLKSMINESDNSEANWEIPKGHHVQGETNIDTAMRELFEETGIRPDKYTLQWHTPPVVECFSTKNATYCNTYYLAEYVGELPKVSFKNPKQYSEVECIKWVSAAEVKFLRMNNVIHARTLRLMKKINNAFKHRPSIASQVVA